MENQKIIEISTKILLSLNGENGTAFNRRRLLVELNYITNLKEELHFLGLVSLKFKKSSISWVYRLFLAKL